MFPSDSETELEGGCLRSGRIFWLGKRIRMTTRRGSYSMIGREDYKLVSHFDVHSCDEKEEHCNVLDPPTGEEDATMA